MWKVDKWRHADESKLNREKAVDELAGMLKDLIKRAKKEGFSPAPFIGIGVPGKIEEDGSIAKGRRTSPATGRASKFNLPARIIEAIPQIEDHETAVLMHNDAVVQGLSEVPFMQDVKTLGCAHRWHRARQRPVLEPDERQGLNGRYAAGGQGAVCELLGAITGLLTGAASERDRARRGALVSALRLHYYSARDAGRLRPDSAPAERWQSG